MRIFVSFDKSSSWLFGFFILADLYFQSADGTAEDEFPCGQPLSGPIRQFPPKSRAIGLTATLKYGNKPYWPMQWYMNEEMFSVANQVYTPSMRIVEFHNLNLKGDKVGVVIIGNSAVHCDHEEIYKRCLPNSSLYSYHAKKSIISFCTKTEVCSSRSLATAVAGIIGMTDESQKCGVGIAPMCIIGNIIVEPSTKSGSPEHGASKILSVSDPGTYVFVHAWSLSSFDYKNRILHALENIKMLNFDSKRQMRPHVMGSGDLGQFANSCQCNEYTSADSMFVFGSVAYSGLLTSYSETCASLFGVTYSTSDGNEFYNNFITITDSTNDAPTYAPKRTTAVSAAVGGGLIALITDVFTQTFERSPSISDIAFLLAFSCTSEGLKDKNTMWFTNGVGKEYSPQAGFGLPRMDEVLTLLKDWTPMEPPTVYEFSRFSSNVVFKCHKDIKTRSLTYRFNLICFFEISNPQAHRYIQLITVELSAQLMKRGALSVYLISPAGTVSCILEGRPYDVRKKNYKKLLLRTNHFIGETSLGQWSIRFHSYKEDSRPSYETLHQYWFPTHLQSTTAPTESQFHNAGHHQPISPVGTSNPDPHSATSTPQASSNSQFAGQLVTGGVSSPKAIYPSFFPNPTGKDSAGLPTPLVPTVQPPTNQPLVQSHSEIRFTTTNSPNIPNVDASHNHPDIIDQVKFRFLLVENVPSALKLRPSEKPKKQSKLDFELIKAWVDFKHFLLVQTDPKNFGTSTVGLWEVYDFSNLFTEKLLKIQKKLKINSATPSPLERLQRTFSSDVFPNV